MTPSGNEELEIRRALWLGHGHKGVYGDDGEMQCAECIPMWDYKRQPLIKCVNAALSALHKRCDAVDELTDAVNRSNAIASAISDHQVKMCNMLGEYITKMGEIQAQLNA